MVDLTARMPRPRIGLLPTGHFYYWDQFPGLRDMGLRMYGKLREHLEATGDVIAPDLVDTEAKARAAGDLFRKQGWEYLWVRYADAEDSGVLVKPPLSAYVEQVYEYGDFRQLAIGT